MIRVNLAKSHNYTATGTQTAIAMDQAMLAAGPHPAVKVLVMLILPILLYGYESYNISRLSAIARTEEAKDQKIQRTVSEFGSVKAVVEGLVKEKQRLNEQLRVIKKISQKRAYKLRAVEEVQKSLTEDLWLNELVVDENLLEFKGISRTASSVQEIVKNIGKNDFIESAESREIKRIKIDKESFNTFDIVVRVKK